MDWLMPCCVCELDRAAMHENTDGSFQVYCDNCGNAGRRCADAETSRDYWNLDMNLTKTMDELREAKEKNDAMAGMLLAICGAYNHENSILKEQTLKWTIERGYRMVSSNKMAEWSKKAGEAKHDH